MVRKTEKLELFCKKYEVIPSIGVANLSGQITFKLWYDQYDGYPNVVNADIKKMLAFSFSGINFTREFLELKKEVLSEIEDNLIEASSEFELKKFFSHIKGKLDDIFFVAKYNIEKLQRITFDIESDDFKNLNPEEKEIAFIFYTSMLQAKHCFDNYLEVQSFIEEQQNLYLDKPENIEIAKISDRLSHKILLLHELGIIEYLQKAYFQPQQALRNGTDLANLVSNIIGEPSNSNTIRKHISGIHSKGKDCIVTKPGIKEVKKFLMQFDIPLQRLKDID